MTKEIDSHDVKDGHLAQIASGALVVRANRLPHDHESNDSGRTGGGLDVPQLLRTVGGTVSARRTEGREPEEATLISVGEGVAVVVFTVDKFEGIRSPECVVPWDSVAPWVAPV